MPDDSPSESELDDELKKVSIDMSMGDRRFRYNGRLHQRESTFFKLYHRLGAEESLGVCFFNFFFFFF